MSPWKDENGNYKWYGRFNRGVVTLNLVDIALSARKNEDEFWRIMDERLELVKKALMMRSKLLEDATSDVSPIHWQYGGIARLKSGEKINKYLRDGYSTISLGYIGIYEMCMAMFGKSNTDKDCHDFCVKVMKHLNDKCTEWKNSEVLLQGCGVYGTPSESLCYKFAQKTARRFGEIKGVTDRDYFTNSYHVNVREKIDAFNKLKFESEFQNMSLGGAVSYIEVPNMNDNLEALADIVNFMYDNIQYAEVNTRGGDYCSCCGYTGEITVDPKDNKWTCPKCGNKDFNKMNIARRVCGYISSSLSNAGKRLEMSERVYHI